MTTEILSIKYKHLEKKYYYIVIKDKFGDKHYEIDKRLANHITTTNQHETNVKEDKETNSIKTTYKFTN
jgi:hypothetical protein